MATFMVAVNEGLVSNSKTGATRKGWWIPLKDIPKSVRQQLGVLNLDSNTEGMSWDLRRREWRNMKNAQGVQRKICTATVCEADGKTILALLDI